MVLAIAGGIVSIISIAWHHDLAQAAPMARLGTLNWQVSKIAFDAIKVLVLFYIKNLVMAVLHPARFGQLRAPLVEQRVPADAVVLCCGPSSNNSGADYDVEAAAGAVDV